MLDLSSHWVEGHLETFVNTGKIIKQKKGTSPESYINYFI